MKKINQFFIFIAALILIFLSTVSHSLAEDLIETDKALSNIFPNATRFEAQSMELTDEQIGIIEKEAQIIFGENHSRKVHYYTALENDQILGYALEDIVVGKWGPIHYLVGLDKDGTILQVIVLDYQEIRGRPVAKKRFLRQYKKKSIRDPIKLRKDVDGITGATISSRSLTSGVRKLLHIFQEVISE